MCRPNDDDNSHPCDRQHSVAFWLLAAVLLAAGVAHAQLEPWTGVAFSQSETDPRYDLLGVAEGGDRIGQVVAKGDFDADGFDDLVIGVPDEFAGDLWYAGAVHVVYGSRSGLDARRQDLWNQDGAIVGGTEAFDRFGGALATGDFNCDGFDDLAIGVSGEAIGDVSSAGAVNVIYGSTGGLVVAGNQMWHQDVAGVAGGVEEYDKFGHAVAGGDFDGDGCDDLAISVYGESIGDISAAGAIQVLWGSSGAGLTASGDQWIDRSFSGMGGAIAGERFGWALAAGNFNGDGYDDLAVGTPADSRSGNRHGSVHVIYGASGGLDVASNRRWTLDSPGVDGVPGDDDSLGTTLVVGNFDGDPYDDLAASMPSRDTLVAGSAGGVLVLYGSGSGLEASRSWVLEQGTDGLAGSPSGGEDFGRGLGAGDLDGDGADELVVGVPDHTAGGVDGAGAFHVIPGSGAFGLSGAGDRIWTRSELGRAGPGREYDNLGWAVVLGDFNGGGTADAAASARTRDVGNAQSAGDVVVTESDATILADGFDSGFTVHWSSTVP